MFNFFKTKKGFTLTELLLVVAVIGILIAVAVPIYNGMAKNGRIRACRATRMEAQAQALEWCKVNDFNTDFDYQITSDGTEGTIKQYNSPLNADQVNLLRDIVHEGELPCCPACGTYTITVIPRDIGVPTVTVTCDGGDDGDSHTDK